MEKFVPKIKKTQNSDENLNKFYSFKKKMSQRPKNGIKNVKLKSKRKLKEMNF